MSEKGVTNERYTCMKKKERKKERERKEERKNERKSTYEREKV